MHLTAITTPAQHAAALERICYLMALSPPEGSKDAAELDWLTDLAAAYEDKEFQIDDPHREMSSSLGQYVDV